jgi:hypothetical protein
MSYKSSQRRRARRVTQRAVTYRKRESLVRAVSRTADRIAGVR